MSVTGFKNRLKPIISIEFEEILRSGEKMRPITADDDSAKIEWPGYEAGSLANNRKWCYVPRCIDLGGDIGSNDWNDAIAVADSSKSVTIGGNVIEVLSSVDRTSSDYDKYILSLKAALTIEAKWSSRCKIIHSGTGTPYYGLYTEALTDIATAIPGGFDAHFRYTFHTDGNLFTSKNALTSPHLMKLYYLTQGWEI